MPNPRQQLEDIPGNYVFTRERCQQGMPLNMFFVSLLKAPNRAEFLADERAYLAKFPLTAEQRRCVLERDWSGMLRQGANIYHMSKLGGTDQRSVQYLAGCFSGMTQEQDRDMMLRGGRSIEGNRSKAENAGRTA